MSKNQRPNKEQKKPAQSTAKEKKAAKRDKKRAADAPSFIVKP